MTKLLLHLILHKSYGIQSRMSEIMRVKFCSILIIGIAICGHLVILLRASDAQFPTVDEVGHLPAGCSHWEFGRFDLYRVNPPLVRTLACLPVWLENSVTFKWASYSFDIGNRPEFVIGVRELVFQGSGFLRLFRWARLAGILFSLGGMLILAFWLRKAQLSVRVCGFVILFWCFSPDILAHAATIGPDVGSVSFGILCCFACWWYLHNPSFSSAAGAGIALGLALLTKLTWLTAVVTLPFACVVSGFFLSSYLPVRSIKGRIGDLFLFWGLGLLVLNAGYLFEGAFRPLGEYEFCSEMLRGEDVDWPVHGNRFQNSWLATVPVPVPRNYLLGIDHLKCEVERRSWSFLAGEWKFGSWPHYYVMTTLYKTPESTLLGALIGLGVLIIGVRRQVVSPGIITMFLLLGIPAGVCFASVSLQGGFNHHHRYVLMIYPPIFALNACVASQVAIKLLRFRIPFCGPTKRSIAVPLAFTLVSVSVASTLRIHPYYTSYFNTLSGGPENGWRLLGFSNIDWGQGILDVEKWIKEHPERRPLVMELSYFDRKVSQSLFSVPSASPRLLPKGASVDEIRRTIDETQWWIISVKELYNKPGQDGLEYLQQLEPVDRIAYSYHVYRIDPLFDTGSAGQARPDSDAKVGSKSDPGN